MLFAVSGLVCWCGISQIIGNSISSSFENAFSIPPLWSTVALVALAAVIVLRKNATVKVLDVVVPVMAACYFFITLLICSCTAMVMLLTPSSLTEGLEGMDLLQAAMGHHLGAFGVAFIAAVLWLFSFSTFLGVLFYARSNVAYLFGDSWRSQTAYKLLALAMLFVGGLAAYQFVWDLGDVGIGLMTVFNMIALLPLAPKALASLRDYERSEMKRQ